MAPPSVSHLIPDDDVIGHEASERCVCGPHRISGDPDEYGRRCIVLVHPRLDGKAPEVT